MPQTVPRHRKMLDPPTGCRLELLWAGASEGRTVLLVPGALADAATWWEVPGWIRGLLDGGVDRVMALSLRGRGGSDRPDGGYTAEHHASDVLVALEAEGPAVVIGHSMGAGYACGAAVERPDLFEGLVCGDYVPAIPPASPAWVEGIAANGGDADLARRIAAESELRVYGRRLAEESTTPLLVLQGTGPSAMLDDATVERFYGPNPNATVVGVPTGHDVFHHPDALLAVVRFLSTTR